MLLACATGSFLVVSPLNQRKGGVEIFFTTLSIVYFYSYLSN